jgi:H+-transporting ATPase
MATHGVQMSSTLNASLLENEHATLSSDADYHSLESGIRVGRPSQMRPSAGMRQRKSSAREYVAQKEENAGRRRTSVAILAAKQAALDAAPSNPIRKSQVITPAEAAQEQHFEGLSAAEAERLLVEHGPNAVQEKEVSILWMYFGQYWEIMPICMAICVIICGIATDFIDCILIVILLLVNGNVGFKEEYDMYCELQSLIDSEVKTCRCIRDGKLFEDVVEVEGKSITVGLPVELLVPGDIVSLKIGDSIPADCEIVEGNVKMDTKAVTGEPEPWKVPRPDKKDDPPGRGKELWASCPIMQGECYGRVIRTGGNSIVGEISAKLADKDTGRKSDFEEKILLVVKIIISMAFGIGVVMFLTVYFAYEQDYTVALKTWVAVLMGSIPIALPLVLSVVMSMGIGVMAREKAVVSEAAALSDIASMTILNSDKTGTLTTAIMDINYERIHAEPGFTKDDILEFAVVCSNRMNADDAIDGAIVRKFDEVNGGSAAGEQKIKDKWSKSAEKGFNNAAKRTECIGRCGNDEILIVKGLPPKLLRNNDPNEDAAENEDQSHTRFECKDYANIKDRVIGEVHKFEDAGLKTIGVAIRRGANQPVEFAGILPMMDPPRVDASWCVKMMMDAGVEVKMVTGDAVNIAKTTAGDIGIGTNILPNSAFKENSGAQLHKCVLESNGFAQVMPKDKETVVLEEQDEGYIVGFCGDGANDALALNAAHVGIAVADAMDAAIKASAIQLRDPGLACIYTAIVESRKIFRRIKSYVVFRIAATVQMILVLSILTFVSGCNVDLIYVVLLALFNDLSMIMIGQDNQKASKLPDRPNVWKILAQATLFGLFQLIMSVIFFYIFNSPSAGIFENVKDSYHVEPVTWFNYLQSRKGFGDSTSVYPQDKASDRVNKYQQCMQTICPTYKCSIKKQDSYGGYVTADCNFKCADADVWTSGCQKLYKDGDGTAACSTPDTPATYPAGFKSGMSGNYYSKDDIATKLHGFCPGSLYTPSDLPYWQECCVKYADLQHPGTVNFGSPDNYCTEVTTVHMFIQLLISSELMIFPVRTLSWMFSTRPAWSVTLPVIGTCAILSILAALGVPEDLGPLGIIIAQATGWKNWAICIAWGVLATGLLDGIKYAWVSIVDGSTEEIDYERVAERMVAEGVPLPDSMTATYEAWLAQQ